MTALIQYHICFSLRHCVYERLDPHVRLGATPRNLDDAHVAAWRPMAALGLGVERYMWHGVLYHLVPSISMLVVSVG